MTVRAMRLKCLPLVLLAVMGAGRSSIIPLEQAGGARVLEEHALQRLGHRSHAQVAGMRVGLVNDQLERVSFKLAWVILIEMHKRLAQRLFEVSDEARTLP